MREPYYNIIIMSTFSVVTVTGDQKMDKRMGNGYVVKLNYPVVVDYH